MENYTIRYTIFADISFEDLKEEVSDFLKEGRFVRGEDPDDNLRDYEIINEWRKHNDKCYVVVYPSRMHYSYIGSGIGVSLLNANYTSKRNEEENMESLIENAENDFVNEPEPFEEEINIPEFITHRFERRPNVIKIDSHKYWLDHSDLSAHKIGLYLGNNGFKTYMLSFSDELYFIKRNPIYTDEERIEKILNYMEAFLFNMDVDSKVQSELKIIVGSKWDSLEFRIKKFLVTGFFLFDLFDQKGDLYVDVSPASIAISKGIETIVLEYLQKPFKRYCIDTYGVDNLREILAEDKEFSFTNRMFEFLLEDNRSLELGTFNFFVNKVISDPTTQKTKTGQLLIEFLQHRELYDFIVADPANFNQPIYRITNVYRNGAAHTKEMEFSKLLEYVHLLIGVDRKDGFLNRLITRLV